MPPLLQILTNTESWVRLGGPRRARPDRGPVGAPRGGPGVRSPCILGTSQRAPRSRQPGSPRSRRDRPVELMTDPSWAVRGAAAECLGRIGGPEDITALRITMEDPHPWPRRGAIYSMGRLGLTEAAPRVREETHHVEAEVRLAAVWALGRLGDDGAKDSLLQVLRDARPTEGDPSVPIAMGDGAVAIRSDAEGRLFDASIQALGRIVPSNTDPTVVRGLLDAMARVDEADLDRPAVPPGARVRERRDRANSSSALRSGPAGSARRGRDRMLRVERPGRYAGGGLAPGSSDTRPTSLPWAGTRNGSPRSYVESPGGRPGDGSSRDRGRSDGPTNLRRASERVDPGCGRLDPRASGGVGGGARARSTGERPGPPRAAPPSLLGGDGAMRSSRLDAAGLDSYPHEPGLLARPWDPWGSSPLARLGATC